MTTWVLILMVSWGAPALTVIDNISTEQECKRMGDEITKTRNLTVVFNANYYCIRKG